MSKFKLMKYLQWCYNSKTIKIMSNLEAYFFKMFNKFNKLREKFEFFNFRKKFCAAN